jgi:uroporphyrinogen decarboxylase
MNFQPDFRHIVDAARNKKPSRLPLYEHIISPVIMEQVLGEKFAEYELSNNEDELRHFFKYYCCFFKEMTYDTVSYEFPIIYILPAQGAGILGKAPGIIQSRADFNKVDWDGFVKKYIDNADIKFRILGEYMPQGMKAIGGVANGVFEISEELVGLEYLSYMHVDDPELFRDVYRKIGGLMAAIWGWFLKKYGHLYCVCRFGDDLGYKSGLLTSPQVIREHIIPQYRPIIKMVHDFGLPFLWHSCGNIFDIMDDAIAAGIDAKHSNEDIIAPYDTWIERYGRCIGLFGGIDVDLLCQLSPQEIYNKVVELGTRFRSNANGYALGSGNSIPYYIPLEGYLAMVHAAQDIRHTEE